jgi:hypothetical protein
MSLVRDRFSNRLAENPVLDSEEVSSDLPDEEVFVVEAKEWELYFDGSSISTARAA